MISHGRPRTTARHALWFGGLLAVLAGLFGTHGLDSHGAAGTDTVPHAVMTRIPMDAVAAGYGATGAAASVSHHAVSMGYQFAAAVTSVPVAGGHDASDTGTAEMCMAILAVALVALLRLLLISRDRPLLLLLARRARAPGPSGRDPDPPSLISLSIHRC
jgi:hypothetical protein